MDLHLHQDPALFHLSCIAHQYWTAGGQIVNNPVMTVEENGHAVCDICWSLGGCFIPKLH